MTTVEERDGDATAVLAEVARAVLDVPGIASVAVFAGASGSAPIRLVAVAGIAGPPLDGLLAAVRDPGHPVRRAIGDQGPTFNVAPINPGGPALRSHLPLRLPGADAASPAIGVLALAHDQPVSVEARDRMEQLAETATAAIAADQAEESR